MADDEKDERSGERSGRYPGVSLADALEVAEKLYKAERQSPVNNATAAAKMGYKGLSGPARVMIGALRQYGLIEKTSIGQFRLSKLAIEALHGNENQKAKALKSAATNPPLFGELQRTHLEASEDNIQSYLITTKGFIDTGARIAAKAFRDTMGLAKITASGYNPGKDADSGEDKPPSYAVSVGDYVQWESGGVLQFVEPKRVTKLSDDGTHAFVEGSNTGLPMQELSKVEPRTPTEMFFGGGSPPAGVVQPSKPQPAQSMIPPMNWVLSVPRGVRAQLIITGNVKAEDLKRLKAQIDFLVDSLADESEATNG